jgi:ribosomal protein S18 acetylase RimI-like enzyme
MQTTLRTACPADAEFIYRLVDSTMRSYVEQIWGQFNDEYNRKQVADQIAAGIYSIVLVDGNEIGAVAVEREDSHIQLTQLYIHPAHQNRGIGTSLIRGIIAEAKAANKRVRLRVLAVNPARRLYERLGFRVTKQTPERYFMELSR